MSRTDSGAIASVIAPWIAALVTLVLLAGVAIELRAREQPKDPTGFHARLKEQASVSIPYSIGDWIGKKLDPPQAAIEMLHSNVLINRVYTNSRTGESAGFMFVQCSDARDLIGHFPPVCYPAHGQTKKSEAARDWTIGGESIHGMRYHFRRSSDSLDPDLVVDNFMILPDGVYGRDMDAVNKVAQSADLRHFGAAQIQVLTTSATFNDERRDEILRTLLEPIVPLLKSAVTGAADEHD